MVAPFAEITEIDESQRVPVGNGIYAYLQINAPIGPTSLKFIDSETSLLNWFTENGNIEVGYDNAFYSASAYLKKSNKLWVKRVVAQDALHGGCTIPVGTSVNAAALTAGLADPTAYTFDTATSAKTAEKITVTTKNDYQGNLSGTYFVLPGQQYFLYMNIAARAEVTEITCTADVGSSLAGKYFIFPGQTDYIWFKVGTAGTDPGTLNTSLTGMTGHEVGLSANDTAATVASTINTAIGKISDFAFTSAVKTGASNVLVITNATAGAVAVKGNAGDSGFGYVTVTEGLAAAVAPTVEGKTGVSVSFEGDSSASTIATAISTAISGATLSSLFSATVTDNTVTITALTTGSMSNAYDGNNPTTFNIQTVTQGSSQSGSTAFLLYFENQCSAANNYVVKIFNYEDYPVKCPLEGTFVIEVYKNNNLKVPLESFTCSRVESATDLSGNNIYLENVLQGSKYIRAIDNIAVDANEIPRSVPDGVAIGGGSDGTIVTTADKIKALQEIKNRETAEVAILMDGGWSATAYKEALDEVAKTRGDCVAITGLPYYLEDSANYLENIINYRKFEYNINSSYTAIYSPYVNIYDYYNDRYIYVSPDGYIAGAISDADKNYKIWYPVLGFKRGTLTNVYDLKRKYKSGEMDVLYDNQINPIRYIPRKGIVIWGQKTSQVQASSLDRLNVRLLLVAMKPSLQEFLETYIGELNTQSNRNRLKARIDGYMTNIQANDGVEAFRTVCDETNNTPETIANNELYVDMYIRPTSSIEFIKMRITLTSTDVTFN